MPFFEATVRCTFTAWKPDAAGDERPPADGCEVISVERWRDRWRCVYELRGRVRADDADEAASEARFAIPNGMRLGSWSLGFERTEVVPGSVSAAGVEVRPPTPAPEGMRACPAWLVASSPPGEYGLDAPDLGFGPPPAALAPGERLVELMIALPEGEADPGAPGGLDEGDDVVVLTVNDPELERMALGLYEARSAGIRKGDMTFALVDVGQEVLNLAGFADAGRAEGFLLDEVDMAEEGSHWGAYLEGPPEDETHPPVILLGSEGLSTLDGLHRIAGHVLHGTETVRLVIGVEAGRSLAECPGAVPATPAPGRGPVP